MNHIDIGRNMCQRRHIDFCELKCHRLKHRGFESTDKKICQEAEKGLDKMDFVFVKLFR